ncbi:MAG: dockerin type I domain-containing protein [Bdellovibrionota bacterium]
MKRFNPREAGQAQLLTAFALGVVMLSAALYSLDYANHTNISSLKSARRTEMKAALDAGIKQLSFLYHSESACDPVTLDLKLNRLQTDGTILSNNPPVTPGNFTRRQMNVTVSHHAYTVSFGAVTRLPWQGNLAAPNNVDPTITSAAGVLSYNAGTSQDAVVEVWTQFGQTRVLQNAVLINNCNYPCSQALGVDPCLVPGDQALAYHRVIQPANFPGPANPVPNPASWNQQCFGGALMGDVSNPADGTVDLSDLLILKNYLRSGDWTGSSRKIFVGTGAPNYGCADLNGDGLVNEIDLNIMEKMLRGYLYWIPTHCKIATGGC